MREIARTADRDGGSHGVLAAGAAGRARTAVDPGYV